MPKMKATDIGALKWKFFWRSKICHTSAMWTLERPLGTNRPDVSAEINGVPVAIEMQIRTFQLKMIRPTDDGISPSRQLCPLAFAWTPSLDAKRYTPRQWEKWIHAAYFGRMYYWLEGFMSSATILTRISNQSQKKRGIHRKARKSPPQATAAGQSVTERRFAAGRSIWQPFCPPEPRPVAGEEITIPAAKLYINRHLHSGQNRNKGPERH